nr:hypothetical protein [Tanacetum cinerariifolium]
MTWEILKEKLTDKDCPKGEIKKLEIELWNLKVKRNDVGGYTQHFHELALMSTKFISNETKKVNKYISRLLDNMHGNVMAARPKTLDDAIELANDLMDQTSAVMRKDKIRTREISITTTRLNNNFSRNKMWERIVFTLFRVRQLPCSLHIHCYLIKVMDAPTLPVSAKKNPGDPIDIRVDIVHPTPADVFSAATVVRTLAQHGEAIRGIHRHLEGVPINEEMNALRFRMGMVEEKNASLRDSIKTMEAIDTITRR